jgi:hypothetical protein
MVVVVGIGIATDKEKKKKHHSSPNTAHGTAIDAMPSMIHLIDVFFKFAAPNFFSSLLQQTIIRTRNIRSNHSSFRRGFPSSSLPHPRMIIT